jgi:hypothetical protein
MAAETRQMSDPWRIHPSHPVLDDDSAQVLEEAVRLLGVFRSPLNAGHAGLRLHVLASLINQADALIPDAVADARHQDFSWSEIGQELGVTTKTARRRYGAHARSAPLDPD